MGKCKLLGGGINIGKYVWERYSGNPTNTTLLSFTKLVSTDKSTYTVVVQTTSSNSDFPPLTIDDFKGMYVGGKVWSSSQGTRYCNLYVGENGTAYADSTGASRVYGTASYNQDTQQITFNMPSFNITYLTESTSMSQNIEVAEKITLLDFAVGNSPTLYPEDGLQSKYYYKLLASVGSTNTLSLTDTATTTIKNIAIEEVQREVTTNVDQ